MSNQLTYLIVHATGELIIFGFSDSSVRTPKFGLGKSLNEKNDFTFWLSLGPIFGLSPNLLLSDDSLSEGLIQKVKWHTVVW